MNNSEFEQFLETLRERSQSATYEQKLQIVRCFEAPSLVFRDEPQFFGSSPVKNISMDKFLGGFISALKTEFGEEAAVSIIKEIIKSLILRL